MSTVYAECVACGVLVADLSAHAAWHGVLSSSAPGLDVAATTTDPTTGVPVAPVAGEYDAAVVSLRARASAAVGAITTDALPVLDAYLAIPAPTQAQALAQVRTLTTVVRGLALAVRGLLRLASRRLEAVD